MKHTTSIIKLFSLALFVLVGTACIDNFDKINQKDYQVDKEELGREGYNVGASLKGLQGLVIPTEEHLYQFVEALAAGAFSGYIGCTVEWTAKFEGINSHNIREYFPTIYGITETNGYTYPRS